MLIVGVVFRGGCWLDGVRRTSVEVDGFDAVDKIATMILASPHKKQLRVIMLDGVTFAGFNVVDIRALNVKTRLPVIAGTGEKARMLVPKLALNGFYSLPRFKDGSGLCMFSCFL